MGAIILSTTGPDCLSYNPGSTVHLLLFLEANYLTFPSLNLVCEVRLITMSHRTFVKIR